MNAHSPDPWWCWRREWQERLGVVVIATPSTGGGLIKMALPNPMNEASQPVNQVKSGSNDPFAKTPHE